MQTKITSCISKLIVAFVAIGCCNYLQAQTEKIFFDRFGVKEGLPEESIFSIIQDKQGFIWAATRNGLVKYDGYKMHVYQGDRQTPGALGIRNLSGGLLLGRDGKLWMGAEGIDGGLSSFDPRTGKFSNYLVDFSDTTKIPFTNCSLIYEDIAGNIWFANRAMDDQGWSKSLLCRLDTKTGKVRRYNFPTVGGAINNMMLDERTAESKADSCVWFLFSKGLYRYDRRNDQFELIVKTGDIIPGTSVRDSIKAIFPAGKSGLIPMVNNQKLFLWDPIKGKVTETFHFPQQEFNGPVLNAFEDWYGNFWYTSDDELTRINRKTGGKEHYKFGERDLYYPHQDSADHVMVFQPQFQDSSSIWFFVSSRRSIFFFSYDHKQNKFQHFNRQFNEASNDLTIYHRFTTLFKDRSGIIWLGSRPNLYKENNEKQRITRYYHQPRVADGLPSDTVYCILEDSEKNLWAGTKDGLALMEEPGKFTVFKNDPREPNSYRFTFIVRFFEDSDKNIWITNGDGVDKWDRSTRTFHRVIYSKPPADGTAFYNGIQVSEDKQGRIWALVNNKGVYILDKKGKILKQYFQDTKRPISKIYHDSRGNTWLGLNFDVNSIYRFTDIDKELINYKTIQGDTTSPGKSLTTFFIEDKYKNLWIGTRDHLLRYNYDKDNFTRFFEPIKANNFLYYAFDKNGEIWFGTSGSGGIVSLNNKTGRFETYGQDKGLLHNDILGKSGIQLITDNKGRIWLPTEKGLSVFDPATKTFINYTEKSGYIPTRFFQQEILSLNGDIWLATWNGIFRYNSAMEENKNSIPPQVQISSLSIVDSVYAGADGKLFKEAVSVTSKIKLKYWQKDIAFDFVALHYQGPEDNLYSWKLENYDKTWSVPSKNRNASYTNLSPGTYTFRVKASNADGVWNEEGASITIVILPPWWRTWWASIFYVLIAGAAVYAFIRWRTKALQKEKEVLEEKVTQRTAALNTSLENLKATQAQLIQSEKMASLGELTAGIAHEIQNPLNFVNNFSEVSNELVDEMNAELNKGDIEEAKAIANDVKQNLEKINHHGKRADAIVKGMLQHSRSSNGIKEPTDINALADEYLRLSYHGLRAKDKSFNATMKTDFDDSIGKISIIPQDIGRVILNLVNNAFYAVNEKTTLRQAQGDSYEPTVTLSTRNLNGKVEIKIRDNGNGIPQKLLNKIFQPFFTTKPTGQGTGLGLSLSYDIVKAHGGDLQVRTKDGEFSEFLIQLPGP